MRKINNKLKIFICIFTVMLSTIVYGWAMSSVVLDTATMTIGYWSMPEILVTVVNEDKTINPINLDTNFKLRLNDSTETTIPINVVNGQGTSSIQKLIHGDSSNINYIFSLDLDPDLFDVNYEIKYEDLNTDDIDPTSYEKTGEGLTTGEISLISSEDVYIKQIKFNIIKKQQQPVPTAQPTIQPTVAPNTSYYYSPSSNNSYSSYETRTSNYIQPVQTHVPSSTVYNTTSNTINPYNTLAESPATQQPIVFEEKLTQYINTTDAIVLGTVIEQADSTIVKIEVSSEVTKKENPKTADHVPKFYLISIVLVACIALFIKIL